jgi:hypothetical protein
MADMRKRGDTRFWISIIASAFVFPVAAIAMFAVWFIRFDFPLPTDARPSPALLAATPSVPSGRKQVEAAVTLPLTAIAAPAATSPVTRTPEALSTMLVLGNARPVTADPVQDVSTAESPRMPVEPVAEPISPQPKQPAEEMPESAAPQPDTKVSERAFVPMMNTTLAIGLPMLGNTPPAYPDTTWGNSPLATLTIPLESAAPERSGLIERTISLPKPRPRITIANIGPTMPLPRPRPVENSSPRTARQ